MIKFNVLIVLRRLLRNKTYTTISIVSISIALAIVLFLLNFIVHELKTDQFHKNKKQIVRVLTKIELYDQLKIYTPTVLAPTVKEEVASVINFARIHMHPTHVAVDVRVDKILGSERNFAYADKSLFDIFSFPIILGTVENLDDIPNSLVISEKKAQLYFGHENPVGQSITFDFYDDELKKDHRDFQVVAVMKDIPSTSTIQADFITNLNGKTRPFWSYPYVESYFQLRTNTNIGELENQIAEIQFKHYGIKHYQQPKYGSWILQPITNIHFYSNNIEGGSAGSLIFVKILGAISILVLSVAFFNYLLLNTSLSLKYLNTHKILTFNGASSNGIFYQESIYTLLQMNVALFLAIPLAKIIHQHFGTYLGNQQFILYNSPLLIFCILLFCIITSFVLAFLISHIFFKSLKITQSNKGINLKKQQSLGSFLIVGQIVIFIGLLMSSILLLKQMNFIQNKDPGCNLTNTISFRLDAQDFSKVSIFREEALKAPYITNFSHGVPLPFNSDRVESIIIDNNPEKNVDASLLQGDSQFIEVYQIPIIEGRNLDQYKHPKTIQEFFLSEKPIPTEVLVNETFAKSLNKKDVLGTIIKTENVGNGIIVGIIKDFHSESYYKPIRPIIIAYNTNYVTGLFSVKFQPGYLAETEKYIKEIYTKIFPETLFFQWPYKAEDAYKKDINRTNLISGLTIITILISILGLIGWSLLTTENRTKEIGIRKINGAKVSEVMTMLNRDFVNWVAIAFVLATPLAYYAMNKWLQNFAYKTEMNWWIFAIAGLLALGITLLTVSWQSWRAATRNPVEALRYE
jgi:putative ABC transport system permease protein